MFMFHRLLNVITMMYNESEELTVCHFIRRKKGKQHTDESEAEDERPTVQAPLYQDHVQISRQSPSPQRQTRDAAPTSPPPQSQSPVVQPAKSPSPAAKSGKSSGKGKSGKGGQTPVKSPMSDRQAVD